MWEELHANQWSQIDGCTDTIIFDNESQIFEYTYITDLCGFMDKYEYYGSFTVKNSEKQELELVFKEMKRDGDRFSITPRSLTVSFKEYTDHVEFSESLRSPFWKKPTPTNYYFRLHGQSQLDEYFKMIVP